MRFLSCSYGVPCMYSHNCAILSFGASNLRAVSLPTFGTQTRKASPGISPGGTCFLNVCMSSKSGGSGRAPATLSHKPAHHIQPFPAGYCWAYQRGNKCTATQCKFKHVQTAVLPRPTEQELSWGVLLVHSFHHLTITTAGCCSQERA